MEKEKQDVEKKLAEANKDKEKFQKLLKEEKDKIGEQMAKERQDAEKKLAEVNKDKEKFEKMLKEEKEKAAPLPYLPMAPPPRPSSSASRVPQVSRTSSTESHPRRRSSVDSQASTIHFDMLQFPNGERERGSRLSDIPEDASAGKGSPSVNPASGSAPPPTWFTNPPIDYGKNDSDINRRGTVSRRFPWSAYILPFPTSPMVLTHMIKINAIILHLLITMRRDCVGQLAVTVLMNLLSYLQYVALFFLTRL